MAEIKIVQKVNQAIIIFQTLNSRKPAPKKFTHPPVQEIFLSLAGGVRALWVSEHPLWRTRYMYPITKYKWR